MKYFEKKVTEKVQQKWRLSWSWQNEDKKKHILSFFFEEWYTIRLLHLMLSYSKQKW